MRIASRRKTLVFFIVLGVCLVAVAIALNVSWIILNWREGIFFLLGVVCFIAIIAGLILYTSFLVREIRRNEQHDTFINAVTHELKTPITSIRLYLETLQSREVDPTQRQQFYRSMLLDADRLQSTVEQVLKGRETSQKPRAKDSSVTISANWFVNAWMARDAPSIPTAAMKYQALQMDLKFAGTPENLRTAISNILDNAVNIPVGIWTRSVRNRDAGRETRDAPAFVTVALAFQPTN